MFHVIGDDVQAIGSIFGRHQRFRTGSVDLGAAISLVSSISCKTFIMISNPLSTEIDVKDDLLGLRIGRIQRQNVEAAV